MAGSLAAMEDRINRACERAFGSVCVYTSPAGDAYPEFVGEYNRARKVRKVDPATHTTYTTTDEALCFSRADLSIEPEQGGRVVITTDRGAGPEDVTFEVREVAPEGNLAWLLSVREVAA